MSKDKTLRADKRAGEERLGLEPKFWAYQLANKFNQPEGWHETTIHQAIFRKTADQFARITWARTAAEADVTPQWSLQELVNWKRVMHRSYFWTFNIDDELERVSLQEAIYFKTLDPTCRVYHCEDEDQADFAMDMTMEELEYIKANP